MYPLNEIYEYEFTYENKHATVYKLNEGVKIIGFKYGTRFDLRVLSIGRNPKRKGFGQKALRFLRPKFKIILVSEIWPEVLPFWIKMKERGLVDELMSIKNGRNLYLLKHTIKPEVHVRNLISANTWRQC